MLLPQNDSSQHQSIDDLTLSQAWNRSTEENDSDGDGDGDGDGYGDGDDSAYMLSGTKHSGSLQKYMSLRWRWTLLYASSNEIIEIFDGANMKTL